MPAAGRRPPVAAAARPRRRRPLPRARCIFAQLRPHVQLACSIALYFLALGLMSLHAPGSPGAALLTESYVARFGALTVAAPLALAVMWDAHDRSRYELLRGGGSGSGGGDDDSRDGAKAWRGPGGPPAWPPVQAESGGSSGPPSPAPAAAEGRGKQPATPRGAVGAARAAREPPAAPGPLPSLSRG